MKDIKVLFVVADDMAKNNIKFTKTGKYYPPADKLIIDNRHWCWNCKLYHLKKDMAEKNLCNECKPDIDKFALKMGD